MTVGSAVNIDPPQQLLMPVTFSHLFYHVILYFMK